MWSGIAITAVCIWIFALVPFVIGGFFSNSILLTPPFPILRIVMEVLGLAVGLTPGALLLASCIFGDHPKKWRAAFGALFLTALFGIAYWVIFSAGAEFLTSKYVFWNSTAPITRELYPIRYISKGGRGGPDASISAPEGHAIVAASHADRALVEPTGRADGYCISLLRQQEGEAVRVFRPPSIPRASVSRKTVTIERCPTR